MVSNKKKQLSGTVLSNKMDKTLVINVTRQYPHPMYKKYVNSTKKYYVHDENNKCEEGDIIIIEESKPLSKLKRWKVKEIIKKAVKI